MAKRKRLEAWAVTSDNYYPNAHLYRTKKQATDDTFTGERLVRLVECGPGEVPMDKRAAAVVRAAVRECASHTETPGFCECDLCRAVEAMKERMR